MKVDYYHQKDNFYGNITWDKKLGEKEETHPIKSLKASKGKHPLDKFRDLGYYASCYPEGDGIAIKDGSELKTAGMVADDIINCFGWSVCINTQK